MHDNTHRISDFVMSEMDAQVHGLWRKLIFPVDIYTMIGVDCRIEQQSHKRN
jgi:hypothetical protein